PGKYHRSRRYTEREPKRDQTADENGGESDQKLSRWNVGACKMKHDADDHARAEGKDRAKAAADQRSQDADADDGRKMIEPDHRMSEPGQQPLHEGDGQLAAHHVVGKR